MNINARIYAVISSDKFFFGVLVLFVLQSLWLVFSAAYPMAFDEAYHFGVIQIYAQQWLPFLAEHPESADQFAAVHRYPSYLFHYLLSFPYRLVALFTDSQYVQVVALRLINVGVFAYSLVLFKKLFLKAGVSKALSNTSILLFTLIPIVPLLAAHINYDNALILLVAWMLLVATAILSGLQNRKMPVYQILVLIALFMFSSVVKYAVLPILLAIALYLLAYGIWIFRYESARNISAAINTGWHTTSKNLKVVLPLLVVIGGVLFFERYGLNMLRYQTLVPKCDQVLTVEQCMEFGPYERNFYYREAKDPDFSPNIVYHGESWLRGMWYRLFFMINGDVEVDRYQNYAPLPLPALAATAILLAGIAAFMRWPWAVLRGRPLVGLFTFLSLLYMVVLWQQNYQGYASLGRTAALNGRYLLPVLLPLIAVMGLGLSKLLKNKPKVKLILVAITLFLFLQGGGLISFIVRSNPNWYWGGETIETVNSTAQEVVSPLIYGSNQEHLKFVEP